MEYQPIRREYWECPYCQRRFNEESLAVAHMEQCTKPIVYTMEDLNDYRD